MGLFKDYVSQTRRPEGILGKMMLRGMDTGHAKMADWGMTALPSLSPTDLADLGCGGGRDLAVLLEKYPSARGIGIDHSALAVERARKRTADSGRCTVMEGDVSALPLEDGTVDLVTAFETIYFWPGLDPCFREVLRILRPGGTFLIVNESDGRDASSLRFEKIIDGMKTYTPEKIREALEGAGFGNVQVTHHGSRPWIAVVARRP